MNEKLFPDDTENTPPKPLADKMRPKTLEEFVGQSELLADGRPLLRLMEEKKIPSLILWGPPGCGKTTLARLMAEACALEFIEISAVDSGVKELRAAIERAKQVWRQKSRKTALFIDEVHRFGKVQQDAILPKVESGEIIVIGSTTENPALEVIPALKSRVQIFRLAPLASEEVELILDRAIEGARGINSGVSPGKDVVEKIAQTTGGDARAALNLLEASIYAAGVGPPDIELVTRLSRDSSILYDKNGQEHYDHASAFQKSMRGSDPDAAIYWLAKMLKGGEDPRFIARRLMVTASEDVGLADPAALLVAVAAAESVERLGMPECRITLAHATIHIATAPKSNSTIKAINKAMGDIAKGESYSTPDHLKDTHYRAAKEFGFGKGYKYPHDCPEHFVEQEYLPPELSGKLYYTPSDQGRESAISDFLKRGQKNGKP